MKIEKNIPIPAIEKKIMRKYPFGEMDVGDSFFVHGEKGDDRAAIAARKYAHDQKVKGIHRRYVSRAMPGGFRIWRVE
ncbi:MAG: hypothetical protein M0Q95_21240 [Porticoccaceae bacterium]|nr:hypothetical protein [Porticoccaceae bacterium]